MSLVDNINTLNNNLTSLLTEIKNLPPLNVQQINDNIQKLNTGLKPAPAPQNPTPAPSPAPQNPAPNPAPAPQNNKPAPVPAPAPSPQNPTPAPAPTVNPMKKETLDTILKEGDAFKITKIIAMASAFKSLSKKETSDDVYMQVGASLANEGYIKIGSDNELLKELIGSIDLNLNSKEELPIYKQVGKKIMDNPEKLKSEAWNNNLIKTLKKCNTPEAYALLSNELGDPKEKIKLPSALLEYLVKTSDEIKMLKSKGQNINIKELLSKADKKILDLVEVPYE